VATHLLERRLHPHPPGWNMNEWRWLLGLLGASGSESTTWLGALKGGEGVYYTTYAMVPIQINSSYLLIRNPHSESAYSV